MKQTGTAPITEGVIWKQLLRFFFPILIGTLFQQLYNTVDALVIGQFVGKDSLAAVGTTGTLVNLLVNFFVGIASGATVIISQYFGAGDAKNVSKAVHTSIAFSIASGILVTAIGLFTATSSLRLLQVPQDIFDEALLYLQIYYFGMLASMIYNIGTGILRAIGDSRTPLYILIVSCILNIVLDLFFVVVIPWGVAGAAIATVLSQVFSAVLILARLMRAREAYRVRLRLIRFHRSILKGLLKIGMPTGLQSVMYSLSNLMVQSTVNAFGTDTIAAWTIFGKIDAVIWMVVGSFGIAVTTFSGQNYGAMKYDRIKKGTRICLLICVFSVIGISLLLFVFSAPLFSFFTGDSGVIRIGRQMMNIMVPFYFIYAFIEIYSGTIRGVGEVMQSTIITFAGICILRIAWLVFYVPFHQNINALVVNYPLTWMITAIAFIVYYLRGNWLKRAISRQKPLEESYDSNNVVTQQHKEESESCQIPEL